MTIVQQNFRRRRLWPALPVAAALVLALLIATPPGRTLADQFLTIFRAQDFAVIRVETLALTAIPDLSQLGEMTGNASQAQRGRAVANLSEATSAAGFPVRAPARLPAAVDAQPKAIYVSPGGQVGFTFRDAKARAYLDSIGRTDFRLPPKFDGASLRVNIPTAVVVTYAKPGAAPGAPQQVRRPQDLGAVGDELIYVQTRSPELEASGVTAEEFRDFLLSVPGLPPALVAQLKAIGDWRTTLPVPVPAGIDARKTTVNGAPALLIGDPAIRLNGVAWLKDGFVYAVGGGLSEAELIDIANSVR